MAMTQDQFSRAEAALRADPGIGARKVMNASGCTRFAADTFLKTARGVGLAEQCLTASGMLSVAEGQNRASRVIEKFVCGEKPDAVRGIALRDMRVSAVKPNEGLRHQFFTLRKGMGFPVPALAEQWNVSEDSLRKHAKRLECLMYVEVETARWEPCVMHPDTAEEYRSQKRSQK